MKKNQLDDVVADFQKAAAFIHEFLLKLTVDVESAELRDALNLALLHMQRHYRNLRAKQQNHGRGGGGFLTQSLRGLSPMTPFKVRYLFRCTFFTGNLRDSNTGAILLYIFHCNIFRGSVHRPLQDQSVIVQSFGGYIAMTIFTFSVF